MAAIGDKTLFDMVHATRRFDIHSTDKYGRSPLFFAAKYGREAILKLLIEEGIDPDLRSERDSGRTLLSTIAAEGHEVAVRTLLETRKVGVDSKDKDGNTPLMIASKGTSFQSSFWLV